MRFRRSTLGVAMLAAAMLGEAASAAVVCQNGNKIKLRTEACRPKETQVATLGGGGDLAGVWEFTGGTLLSYSFVPLKYMVLNADGTGRLHLAGGDGPVVACASVNWSRDTNGTLVIDDGDFVSDTRVYRSTISGGDQLELVDAVGQTGSFDRATAVDPDDDCGSLVESARYTNLPRPDDGIGLVFDGTDLWYKKSNSDDIVSVDPGNGSTGISLDIGFPYVHAAQGADFWVRYGNQEASRVSRPGQELDRVETGNELDDPIQVRAIAYDGASGALWLRGWDDDEDNQGRLLKVNAAVEPDVLLAAFDFDASVDALTVSGNALFGLDTYTQSVVRIDPATGKVTRTFVIGDRSVFWIAIAAIGDQLFLLGEAEGQGQGVLLVVARPS